MMNKVVYIMKSCVLGKLKPCAPSSILGNKTQLNKIAVKVKGQGQIRPLLLTYKTKDDILTRKIASKYDQQVSKSSTVKVRCHL